MATDTAASESAPSIIDQISCAAGTHVWRGPLVSHPEDDPNTKKWIHQWFVCAPCLKVRHYVWDTTRHFWESWSGYPGMYPEYDLTVEELADQLEDPARSALFDALPLPYAHNLPLFDDSHPPHDPLFA